MSESFQLAFEDYSRAVLQAAVNFTDGDERVQRIWVYTILSKGTIEPTWYFTVAGSFVSAQDPGGVLGKDLDQTELWDETHAAQDAFVRAAMVEPGETPCQVVIDYDPCEGKLSAQFAYADELGLEETDPGWKTRDAWIIAHGGRPIF